MIRTQDGETAKLLTAIEEYTWECLAIGLDNGLEFTPQAMRKGLGKVEAKTLYIEYGSQWKNVYIDSFNSNLKDELLGRADLLHIEGNRGVD